MDTLTLPPSPVILGRHANRPKAQQRLRPKVTSGGF